MLRVSKSATNQPAANATITTSAMTVAVCRENLAFLGDIAVIQRGSCDRRSKAKSRDGNSPPRDCSLRNIPSTFEPASTFPRRLAFESHPQGEKPRDLPVQHATRFRTGSQFRMQQLLGLKPAKLLALANIYPRPQIDCVRMTSARTQSNCASKINGSLCKRRESRRRLSKVP
jgi:hypothetical protein